MDTAQEDGLREFTMTLAVVAALQQADKRLLPPTPKPIVVQNDRGSYLTMTPRLVVSLANMIRK